MKLLAALLTSLSVAIMAVAQTPDDPAAAAARHYQDGLTLQAKAEQASQEEDARRLYAEAIAEYQAAVAAQPDHYQAQVYWGISLTQFALITDAEDQRNQRLIEAMQRFALAANCSGADYVVFEQWAVLMGTYIYHLVPDDQQRITVLKEIQDVCARGLELTTEPNLRAQLERHRGVALLKLAGFEQNPNARQALLKRAITSLRAASQVVAVEHGLRADNTLG
ncbi:hypothetical protein HQ590_14715, partial [bacterium]|nr:hypothetical protein [bacterium]